MTSLFGLNCLRPNLANMWHCSCHTDTIALLAGQSCCVPAVSAAAARAVAAGGSDALLSALAPLGARIYRTLGALSATWLSRLMLTQLTNSGGAGGGEATALIRQLAHAALAQPAQLLVAAAGAPAGAPLRGAAAPAAAAAAESLVPLSSIALSSSMKPPLELLQVLVESQAYQVCACVCAAASGLCACFFLVCVCALPLCCRPLLPLFPFPEGRLVAPCSCWTSMFVHAV